MIIENRTFRSAVTLSIVAHVAIFGSAFAFAQYSGGFLKSGEAVVTVSLISGGIGGVSARKPGSDRARRIPQNSMAPAFPAQELGLEPAGDTNTINPAAPGAGDEGAGTATSGQSGPREGTNLATISGADSSTGGFSVGQWQQLYSAIEQAKTYPRLARERGIEGTVLVRFKVLQTGAIEKVDIVKSSGSDILDTASVRTVYRAAPMPYVNGWVEVPMSYVLK